VLRGRLELELILISAILHLGLCLKEVGKKGIDENGLQLYDYQSNESTKFVS